MCSSSSSNKPVLVFLSTAMKIAATKVTDLRYNSRNFKSFLFQTLLETFLSCQCLWSFSSTYHWHWIKTIESVEMKSFVIISSSHSKWEQIRSIKLLSESLSTMIEWFIVIMLRGCITNSQNEREGFCILTMEKRFSTSARKEREGLHFNSWWNRDIWFFLNKIS